MRAGGGSFVALPYSSELNDIPFFAMQGQRGADFAEALIDQFDVLLAEGESRPRVMGFGVHPFLTGQPYRSRHLHTALEHMRRHSDEVWFTTSDELVAWYLDQTGG